MLTADHDRGPLRELFINDLGLESVANPGAYGNGANVLARQPESPWEALDGLCRTNDLDCIAVVDGESQLSTGELYRRANQLAHCLIEAGVGPDVPVGLCVDRSPEMLIAILGILRAGGGYVPLDPTYPQQRLAAMLDRVPVAMLLTKRAWRDRVDGAACQVLCLDTEWHQVATSSGDDLDVDVPDASMAYVILHRDRRAHQTQWRCPDRP